VDREIPKFRNHYIATGKPMKDWRAAFRGWMLRSREWGAPRASPARNGRATAQDFLDLMHEDADEPPGHAETVVDAAYTLSDRQALGTGSERHRQSVEHDPGRR